MTTLKIAAVLLLLLHKCSVSTVVKKKKSERVFFGKKLYLVCDYICYTVIIVFNSKTKDQINLKKVQTTQDYHGYATLYIAHVSTR